MNVDGITSGLVLDHIRAGKSMDIYNHLKLEYLDCCIALIKNVQSKKRGKKDIIKIDAEIDIDLDVLGYIDPDITVNVIKDGKLVEKIKLRPPVRVTNVITCKNPRCITSVEKGIDQVFKLGDEENLTYRCVYCDAEKTD
jgi:aspartate carbamoyltransferase regulatory subunit